jgi:hypothetical protein
MAFYGALLPRTLWGKYIGVLWKNNSVRERIRENRRSRAERRWVARHGRLAAPPGLVWPSGLSRCASKVNCVSLDEKIMLQKSQLNLTLYRYLKMNNTRNRVFLFCRVIIHIKGIIGKSA